MPGNSAKSSRHFSREGKLVVFSCLHLYILIHVSRLLGSFQKLAAVLNGTIYVFRRIKAQNQLDPKLDTS